MNDRKGVFVVSLDTELGWGTFDVGKVEQYEPAYLETPAIASDLCQLFETYDITATWGLVAHLLEDCEGHHDEGPEPSYAWLDSWYGSLPCVTGVDRSLWYAPQLLEIIRNCSTEQEVGLHGYTHMLLGETGCSREAAQREVRLAVNTLEAHGITPRSYIFPRNRIGYRDILAEHGMRAYRGRDSRWFERHSMPALARKPFRYLDEALIRAPPVVEPRYHDGILEIPGSQVFRPYHDGWQWTPPGSQRRRAIAGLNRAAEQGGVFHLRFHPFDLGFDAPRLLDNLKRIFEHAAALRNDGDLVSLSMNEVAKTTEDRR